MRARIELMNVWKSYNSVSRSAHRASTVSRRETYSVFIFTITSEAATTPATMELSQPFDETKVLIIYTGGTIGMLVGHQGYVPEPYFLTETLFSQHRFHDPLEESLFSHSASVEGFRTWSSASARATPAQSPQSSTFASRANSPAPGSAPHQPSTLAVRSSRPIGAPVPLSVSGTQQQSMLRHPSCRKVSEDVYEAHLPSLVTPRTTANGLNSKRIRYVVLEVCLLHGSSHNV